MIGVRVTTVRRDSRFIVSDGSSAPGKPVHGAFRGATLLAPWAFLATYCGISIWRYNVGLAGNYDLGIFSQAAKSWSSGGPPSSSIRGLDNLFADHFSPISAVFGLAWIVWADPRSLLLAQAIAVAAAMFVIVHAWLERLPARAAAPFLMMIGLSKGVICAVYFDAHEVGLGVVGVSLVCWGLLRRRLPWTWGGSIILVLTKEDLGMTVICAGVVWFIVTRNMKQSLGLVAAGAGAVISSFWIIRRVSEGVGSAYLSSVFNAGSLLGAGSMETELAQRFAPVALFTLAAGIVGLRSPIAILALPTLAWRFLSSNPAYWQTYFHYDLVLVPIAALALLDTLERRRLNRPTASTHRWFARRQLTVIAALALTIPAYGGLEKITSLPMPDVSALSLDDRLLAARTLAELIPEQEPIAVQQELGPPLVAKWDVHMLTSRRAASVRWVILTSPGQCLPSQEQAKTAWLEQARGSGARLIRDGNVVLVELDDVSEVTLPDVAANDNLEHRSSEYRKCW